MVEPSEGMRFPVTVKVCTLFHEQGEECDDRTVQELEVIAVDRTI